MHILPALAVLLLAKTAYTETNGQSCENTTSLVDNSTFWGLPVRLSCENLELDNKVYKRYRRKLFQQNFQCIIQNSEGEVILNISASYFGLGKTSVSIPDIHKNSSLNFYATLKNINDSACWNKQIILKPRPNQTCESFNFKIPENNHDQVKYYNESFSSSCEKYAKQTTSISIDKSKMTFRWYHECLIISNQSKLYIQSLKCSHEGLYSCAVIYNGMTLFLNGFKLIVQHHLSYNDPVLNCETTMKKINEGGDVEISCNLVLGYGQPNIRGQIWWAKLSEKWSDHDCISSTSKRYKRISKKTGSPYCYYEEENKPCSTHPSKAEVVIKIIFKKITAKDYGNYTLEASPNSQHRANITFTISPNPIPHLYSAAAIAGLCIGVVLFLLITVSICLHNAIYIRVYYKRYFGISKQDDKEYGAMLAYNFCKEHDIFSQKILQTSVQKTRKFLQYRGYKIYEEGKNSWFAQDRADCIKESIEKSHRVIVFVSKEFIRDGWSMLALLQGFEEMIHSKSKLIFILLPGIKEYVKQHSPNDDTCRLMQRALEVNYVISQFKYDKRFYYQLEDAMPKLCRIVTSDATSRLSKCEETCLYSSV